MAKMPKEVQEVFADLTAFKAMATVDKEGKLNVSNIATVMAIDDETVAFADLFGGVTRTMKNLEETKKVAIFGIKPPITLAPPWTAYQLKGTFQGFETSGSLFDQYAKAVKDAVGLDIRAVGTIKVEEVTSQSPLEPGKELA